MQIIFLILAISVPLYSGLLFTLSNIQDAIKNENFPEGHYLEKPSLEFDPEDQDLIPPSTATYSNESLGFSFDYLTDWELVENEGRVAVLDTKSETSFVIPGESVHDFEIRNKDLLDRDFMGKYIGEARFPTESSKKYTVSAYGSHEGTHYILERDGKSFSITTRAGLDLPDTSPYTQRVIDSLDLMISTLTYEF